MISCLFYQQWDLASNRPADSGTCEVYIFSLQVLAAVCQFESLALDQTLDQQLPEWLPEGQKERRLIHKGACKCKGKASKVLHTVPVSNETLILAEMTEETSIVQVHDGMLLSSDVHVHRQPVISQVALKRSGEKEKDLRVRSQWRERRQDT